MAPTLALRLLSLACVPSVLSVSGGGPVKPENVSCVIPQPSHESVFLDSGNLSCHWDWSSSDPANFTLNVLVQNRGKKTVSTMDQQASMNTSHHDFPYHHKMDVWVEAQSKLGRIQSDPVKNLIVLCFVKLNPPSDVTVSKENSPGTLHLRWASETTMGLKYEIRSRAHGSSNWTLGSEFVVPEGPGNHKLQNLSADTLYQVQVRRQCSKGGLHWSDWSTSASGRTPEEPPTSKPVLWRKNHGRRLELICKDPVESNGRIQGFELRMEEQPSVYVNWSHSDGGATWRNYTKLKELQLDDHKAVKVFVIAFNAAGPSPEDELVLGNNSDRSDSAVGELKVWPDHGQLWAEWRAPPSDQVSEYTVEWVSGKEMDWQRESNSTRRTALTGNLKKYFPYNVSVYPIFSWGVGRPTTREAYLEEEVPLEGPAVKVNGPPGQNHVDLVWKEIPLKSRRGFITNYTIFYKAGSEVKKRTVPGNTTSYRLESLARGTGYTTWMTASTVKGSSRIGSIHSFATKKRATGEINSTVTGATLGCVVALVVLLCCCRKTVIKKYYLPWIPDPAESTIGNWSPRHPLTMEEPKESHPSVVCMVDMDRSGVSEVRGDDTASQAQERSRGLPSEEHSSGIGGSSCLSTSATDSQQGGDLADVSSRVAALVVASSGYKSQTPTYQPQRGIISHSESGGPQLDSEGSSSDRLEAGGDEGSQQEAPGPPHFSAGGPCAHWSPLSYLPQLGGYVPQ